MRDDRLTRGPVSSRHPLGRGRRGAGLLGAGVLLATVVLPTGAALAATQRVAGQGSATTSTVWLCRPGQPDDPCAGNLAATSVSANGTTTPVPAPAATGSNYDCFYVYPTASTQHTANANLKVQPPEIAAAYSQADQFSSVCNVWAPMYRQRTSQDLLKGLGNDPAADQVAYESVLSAWNDFLAHDDAGHPVIFIGHSQGAAMLIRLLHNVIDPSPTLRHLMVSAIILGGNVQVPAGKTVGGVFTHIPTCTAAGQVGCVIAYSSFGSTPPPDTNFGRPGQGVSLQSKQTTSAGQRVACVNPVTFGTAPAPLIPFFPTVSSPTPGVTVTTPWVTYPDLYTAQCKSQGNITWLQITARKGSSDPRPTVTASLGPTWGLHLVDVNIALGDLVHDVARQEAAYH